MKFDEERKSLVGGGEHLQHVATNLVHNVVQSRLITATWHEKCLHVVTCMKENSKIFLLYFVC